MTYLITICMTNVMRMGCFVVISGLFSVGVSNTKYQISNVLDGMDNGKRLGEKKTRSLSALSALSPPLPLSLSLSLCVCVYVGRCSLPISHSHSHSHSHIQKFQITAFSIIPTLTLRYLTLPLRKTAFSHHPIPSIHSPMYCTVLHRIYNM